LEREIKIIDLEPKESKNGRLYYRVKTSEGWMSCFEKDIVDKLKEYKGGMLTVEVAETDNGFKNIRGIVNMKEKPKQEVKEEAKTPIRADDKPAFYVSYAKDIFIAILENHKGDDYEAMMRQSINLVEQARREFS